MPCELLLRPAFPPWFFHCLPSSGTVCISEGLNLQLQGAYPCYSGEYLGDS